MGQHRVGLHRVGQHRLGLVIDGDDLPHTEHVRRLAESRQLELKGVTAPITVRALTTERSMTRV